MQQALLRNLTRYQPLVSSPLPVWLNCFVWLLVTQRYVYISRLKKYWPVNSSSSFKFSSYLFMCWDLMLYIEVTLKYSSFICISYNCYVHKKVLERNLISWRKPHWRMCAMWLSLSVKEYYRQWGKVRQARWRTGHEVKDVIGCYRISNACNRLVILVSQWS